MRGNKFVEEVTYDRDLVSISCSNFSKWLIAFLCNMAYVIHQIKISIKGITTSQDLYTQQSWGFTYVSCFSFFMYESKEKHKHFSNQFAGQRIKEKLQPSICKMMLCMNLYKRELLFFHMFLLITAEKYTCVS